MFKNPFSFTGRIGRTEFVISFIIVISAFAIFAYLLPEYTGIHINGWIYLIPIYWFRFAQGAKRCHDRGNSGWFQLIPLYSLWMLFGISDFGENDYGTEPKSSSSPYVEIDAFALNNYAEIKDSKDMPVMNDEKLVADLYKINSFIKEERRSVFGSNKREPLLDLIESTCKNKEDAVLLLNSYAGIFNSDLITDLSKINKSYNAIKENVQAFIALEVVKPDFPHERI